jgi:hypothetical protein
MAPKKGNLQRHRSENNNLPCGCVHRKHDNTFWQREARNIENTLFQNTSFSCRGRPILLISGYASLQGFCAFVRGVMANTAGHTKMNAKKITICFFFNFWTPPQRMLLSRGFLHVSPAGHSCPLWIRPLPPPHPPVQWYVFFFFRVAIIVLGGSGGAAPVVMFSSAQRGMIFLKNEDDCLNN